MLNRIIWLKFDEYYKSKFEQIKLNFISMNLFKLPLSVFYSWNCTSWKLQKTCVCKFYVSACTIVRQSGN